MRVSAELVARGVRAELVRTSGRSRLWTVLVPAAVAVPAVITFAIALAAETFARIPGQISVLQVPTSNAAYWVITVTTVVVALGAADGQASENRYRAEEYVRLAARRQWPVLVGRWLFHGALGAVVAVAALLVVLVALPVLSPHVYGSVSAADPVALRLLWTVPLLSFFAAGAGVGVGALIRSPLGAAAVILVWVYAFESAAGYLPSGAFLQRFMPVLNGVYATGQDAVLTPPWGQNAALLYVCSLFTAIFVVAAVERTVRHG
ncbi:MULTISPECIES: ABC transporter permease [Mycolicibacterium]|uniref:ABC transporter permease n=1 Tax=Mycolicibacterium TaxID=1866885 RepID=UPI00193D82E6|nr:MULTISPECIES: ABC transporter permease [Mycolicibacterium]MCV7130157.1 ABC transporter permease [Mycolicibacterium vanbaalenii PYR-1]MDW5610807.1 ABC transporter permease [Mycolicibacterium sp. D5.8-2]QZT58861.1 ABC transporter permease [Mycolicibacterium austroafricanum]